MFGLLDENNTLIQKQPNEQEGFVGIPSDAVCGQVMQSDGTFSTPTTEPSAEEARFDAMLTGVEFDGVMCSALKEDQWGLSSVRNYILGGAVIPFKFVNQNTIILDSSNLADFEAVWIPFRASFFTI